MTRAGENRFLLVYGSQTGNAQAIAEEIAEKAPEHQLIADLHCLSTAEKKFGLERSNLIVIIVSTTGDGEVPDTAQKFWRRLKKKTLQSDHYKHLDYCILGLGDSNYSNFCNCGKMIDKRLGELGAKRLMPPVWADDALGLEQAVDPWIDSLWPVLQTYLGQLNKKTDEEHIENNVVINGATANGIPDLTAASNIQVANSELEENTSILKENINLSEEVRTVDLQENNADHQTSENPSQVDSAGQISKSERSDGPENVSNMLSSQRNQPVANQNESMQNDAGLDKNDSKNNRNSESESNGEIEEIESLKNSSSVLSESALNVPTLPPPFLHIDFQPGQAIDLAKMVHQNGCDLPSAKSDITMATILKTTRLTTNDAVKSTLKIELDIQDCDWSYEAGDSFGIICPNSSQEVEQLIERLGLAEKADVPCSLSLISNTKKKNPSVPPHIPPQGATIRHILTTCCDIRTVPKKACLRVLLEYTSEEGEKRRLQELSSRQGSEHYTKYIREAAVSLLDILLTFTSCHPPVERLLEQLPRLHPRPYSAASSPLALPGKVQFVLNVVKIPGTNGRKTDRQGVCTGWLNNVTRGHQYTQEDSLESDMDNLSITNMKVPVYLRSNQYFRPPSDISVPFIMIGPGTGVAPFVGFLQHRAVRMASESDASNIAESWLFFGCRHKERDYIFREELQHFVKTGALTHLHVSFSRDPQPPEGTPRYVQDNMRAHQVALVKLICDEGAIVYVCGDARNMARSVTQAFVDMLSVQKGMTQKEAESFLMTLRLKKYVEDVWT